MISPDPETPLIQFVETCVRCRWTSLTVVKYLFTSPCRTLA